MEARLNRAARLLMGVAICAGAFAAAGCLTTSNDGLRTINSTPPGALVQVEGFGTCETPCTIRVDDLRQVTVAKPGFRAQRFGIRPGRGDIDVILELAAPTRGVDAETLPELN